MNSATMCNSLPNRIYTLYRFLFTWSLLKALSSYHKSHGSHYLSLKKEYEGLRKLTRTVRLPMAHRAHLFLVYGYD